MRYPILLLSMSMLTVLHAQQEDLATASKAGGVQALYEEGQKAYRKGSHAQAKDLFDQVLQLDPEHMNAYLQRGFCNSIMQRYDAAIADFTEVIARKQDHQWAYTSRGSAYNRAGKAELALLDFNKALELDPKDQEAYNNRGWAHKALGALPAACKDWRTSRKLGNNEAKIILSNSGCK